AAQYGEFTVTPGGVTTGGNAGFQGSGCEPGATVTLTINGETVATIVADAQGEYNGSFVVNLAPGNYTVTATCGDHVVTSPLTARGVSQGRPPSSTGGGALPRTGSNTSTLALAGAALLVVGGGAMVAARKRFA